MKKYIFIIIATLIACNDNHLLQEPIDECTQKISITAHYPNNSDTRVLYTEDENVNGNPIMKLSWEREDVIYVGQILAKSTMSQIGAGYLSKHGFSVFTLNSGVSTQTATFTGSLEPNISLDNKLYAYYGKAENIATDLEENKATFSYTLQRQNGNNNTSHLSDYGFMKAEADYSTSPHFEFEHVSTILRFELSGIAGKTIEGITLIREKNDPLSLSITDCVADENGKVIAYMMINPEEMKGETITTYIEAPVVYYTIEFTIPENVEAGKLYNIKRMLTDTPKAYWLGEGTEQNPYQIKTAQDLQWLAIKSNEGNLEKENYFQMVNDIDLSSVCAADKLNWWPIGFLYDFPATFDGNEKRIENLYINEETWGCALFHEVSGCIKNLTVSGYNSAPATGNVLSMYAAGIAGILKENGSIINCCNEVEIVNAGIYCGGIVGTNYGDVISCRNKCDIILNGDYNTPMVIGGIVGSNEGQGYIMDCINEADIMNCGYNTGGITGGNNGEVIACKNHGNISGNKYSYYTGGIAGSNDGKIISSYNTGIMETYSYVGGVIGSGGWSMNVVSCYNTGVIITDNPVSAISGDRYNGIDNYYSCFWKITLKEQEWQSIGTEVDGTNVTWKDAMKDMNKALAEKGYEWEYIENTDPLTMDSEPLILKKKDNL